MILNDNCVTQEGLEGFGESQMTWVMSLIWFHSLFMKTCEGVGVGEAVVEAEGSGEVQAFSCALTVFSRPPVFCGIMSDN